MDISSLIGIPYTEVDCWGIVRMFYKKVFNYELEEYYLTRPGDRSQTYEIVKQKSQEFEKVDTPKIGDIILIRMFGVPSHVGVYIGNSQFLHTSETTDCVIDRLARWEKSIIGFYRVKKCQSNLE